MAHRRRVDAEAAGKIGFEAHRGEFGRTDRKPANGEREVDEAGMGRGGLS
ncbi:hypothetical protein GCM10009102_02690 [Sphingomonas insulae]|uniref:Uncharacterized protein n=1 Tax=Sphingomonas insulae TaxID=424800 RepID=A0ABN1HLH4_9SPHN